MSKEGKIKYSGVGGEALIEGIMMRGPKGNAMSVRLPDGTIETEVEPFVPLKNKYKVLGWPIIRGVAGFIESMATGYKYLMKSADKTMTEEEKEAVKQNQCIPNAGSLFSCVFLRICATCYVCEFYYSTKKCENKIVSI